MEKILIVVGNKERARIYLSNGPAVMNPLENIKNPEAGKKEKDLVSDSPGKVSKSTGSGSRNLAKEQGAVEHALDLYANDIVLKVKGFQSENKGSKILLVSEAGFLGNLKKHFKTAHIEITKTISKELNHLDDKSVHETLKEELKYI